MKGDDEEDDTDDLDNEFSHGSIDKRDKEQDVDEMLHSQMAYGRDTDVTMASMQTPYPLLSNGRSVCCSVSFSAVN